MQGFVPIAKVNSKGRAGKLPIKAEIRKTLCIPGGSTLMVTHLKKNMSIFMMHPLNAEDHPSNPKEALNSPCPGIVVRSRDCSSIPPTKGAKDDVIISNIRPLACQPETNMFDEKKNDGMDSTTIQLIIMSMPIICLGVNYIEASLVVNLYNLLYCGSRGDQLFTQLFAPS